MSDIIVDARGRSCPEPVLMTKKMLDKNAAAFSVLVDNQTALGNVSRLLTNGGKIFEVRPDGEDWRILVK